MPPKKQRRVRVRCPAPSPPPVDEQENTEEEDTVVDPVEVEPEPDVGEETQTKKAAAPRIVTNSTEDEKEFIIDFLQRNPCLYSKRLAGYKDTAAKDRLWSEQAKKMNRTPNELKTLYDSMRTKLGKLKKAVTKSGQAADRFTATELWIWQHFQFLSEHIAQMPRRTVASFTARLQPTAGGGTPSAALVPEGLEESPSVNKPSHLTQPADNSASSYTSSTTGTNPDALMGLLETFLAKRQSPEHPVNAFGSYICGSLRSLPPGIRRRAESRIMGVLHECQNEADQQQFQSEEPLQPAQHDRQLSRTSYGQRPARRLGTHHLRQWQPPPSQWPVEVTNSPDLWHSMDRTWVQQQFPEMNIACPPSNTGIQPQPQPSSSTQSPSTSAAGVQDISYCQMLASDSYSWMPSNLSNSNPTRSNMTSPNLTTLNQERSSTSASVKEKPQDNQTAPDQ